MDKTDIQTVSEFCSQLNFDNIPTDVINTIKLFLIDYLGCAIGGLTTESGRIALRYARNTGGTGHSRVFGLSDGSPVLLASLVNGILGHALQLDDGERKSGGHPGTVVIPAALATTQGLDCRPTEMITAVAVGYEIFIRLGESLNPSHSLRGFHTTGTAGAVAAAAASGRAYQLSPEEMTYAIGLAGSTAGGLLQYVEEGDMSTYWVAGKAAETGCMAAQLARTGFTGPPNIIGGSKGMIRAMTDETSEKFDFASLGVHWKLHEVYFKPYPTCRHIHSAIDAAVGIFHEEGFDPLRVEQINVKTYSLAINECDVPQPTTIPGLDTSLQYCVASALRNGQHTLKERSIDNINDPLVRKLANKVTLSVDPIFDELVPNQRPTKLLVEMDNGKLYERKVIYPKGEPENPMTRDELESKFRECVNPLMNSDQITELLITIDGLEKNRDLKSICFVLKD